MSVPEDLWRQILDALQRIPDDGDVSRRALELDSLHRQAQYESGRSTREQIERGVDSRPYGS